MSFKKMGWVVLVALTCMPASAGEVLGYGYECSVVEKSWKGKKRVRCVVAGGFSAAAAVEPVLGSARLSADCSDGYTITELDGNAGPVDPGADLTIVADVPNIDPTLDKSAALYIHGFAAAPMPGYFTATFYINPQIAGQREFVGRCHVEPETAGPVSD